MEMGFVGELNANNCAESSFKLFVRVIFPLLIPLL
jgi:hypothetical protein